MILVNNEKYFLKYTSRPTYITDESFGKDYAAIHKSKPILILSKPTYIGFTVLDLSIWKMYDFHYNFIKKNCYLLTQTNKMENIYEEFFKWKDLFDFSNYSKDSRFFNDTNKKFIGKMKDDLKSKMYLIKKIDGKKHNTAKDIISFNDKFNNKIIRQEMKRVQSKKRKLGTHETDKVSLSCFGDKRYVLDDEIRTLSYFHKNSVASCNN